MPKYTQTFAPKATAKSPSPYKDDPSDEWSRFMYTGMGSNGTQYNPVTAYTIILYDGSNPEYEQLMERTGRDPLPVRLNAALAGIIRQVMAANSVFAAPVLPVSANTQGTYANQVFMGMFRPDSSALPRWVGNLKQYQFGADLSDPLKPVLFLADAMGKPALSAAGTGFLDPSAVSFWTSKNAGSLPDSADGFWKNAVAAQGATDGFDSADGHIVERGGVSQQIRLAHLTASVNAAASPATYASKRNVLTCIGSGCAGTSALNSMKFDVSNSAITDALLGTSTGAGAVTRENLINWTRGADVAAQVPGSNAGGKAAHRPTRRSRCAAPCMAMCCTRARR